MWDNTDQTLWVTGQQPGYISKWDSNTATWDATVSSVSELSAPPTDFAVSNDGQKIYFAGSTICNTGAFEYRKSGSTAITSFRKTFNGPVYSLALDNSGNLIYAGK